MIHQQTSLTGIPTWTLRHLSAIQLRLHAFPWIHSGTKCGDRENGAILWFVAGTILRKYDMKWRVVNFRSGWHLPLFRASSSGIQIARIGRWRKFHFKMLFNCIFTLPANTGLHRACSAERTIRVNKVLKFSTYVAENTLWDSHRSVNAV
jgi:hypothetical protein